MFSASFINSPRSTERFFSQWHALSWLVLPGATALLGHDGVPAMSLLGHSCRILYRRCRVPWVPVGLEEEAQHLAELDPKAFVINNYLCVRFAYRQAFDHQGKCPYNWIFMLSLYK